MSLLAIGRTTSQGLAQTQSFTLAGASLVLTLEFFASTNVAYQQAYAQIFNFLNLLADFRHDIAPSGLLLTPLTRRQR
jgi:hypothetical protein